MSQMFVPQRLDVPAFAQAGERLAGSDSLSKYERLTQDLHGLLTEQPVEWAASGEIRAVTGGEPQIWLHLQVRAGLPQICQRCLEPMVEEVVVERDFRFVATEAQAEAEDEEAEEDVLELSREFDLRALIEDELLMALPLVPRHAACPQPVRLSAQDADFEAAGQERANPFAALADLKRKP